VAPLLSRFCIEYDVPVHIYQTDVVEISSKQRLLTIERPYRDVRLVQWSPRTVPKEAEGYCSLYREALNNNSPVYQFLCFFKIIEAIRQRRRRIGDELKNSPGRATVLHRDGESVPSDREYGLRNFLISVFSTMNFLPLDDLALAQCFPEEILGKRFGAIIQENLVPVRNKIAHALIDGTGGISLFFDEVAEIDQVRHWLPLTKCIRETNASE
jgi:hypothetical protein